MSEAASISRYGRTEPFDLQVVRGQVAWHVPVTIWGYNPDVDNVLETVWGDGGIVSYISAAGTMNVTSTSTDDASAGTGARTVVIQGLDANYNEISETVTLNGQNTVVTTNSYLHINYAYVATAGSGEKNAGVIYIGSGTNTLGVPAVAYGAIFTGLNASTSAVYTIPSGYTAYIVNGGISAGQASGSSEVVGYLTVRDPVTKLNRVVAAAAFNNGTAEYDFKLPLKILEKHTIEARAIGKSNNNSVAAHFQIILIRNDV